MSVYPKFKVVAFTSLMFITCLMFKNNHSFALNKTAQLAISTTGPATIILPNSLETTAEDNQVATPTSAATTVKVAGDLNQDGYVSLLDLAIASKRINDNSNSNSIDQYNDLELIINLIIK